MTGRLVRRVVRRAALIILLSVLALLVPSYFVASWTSSSRSSTVDCSFLHSLEFFLARTATPTPGPAHSVLSPELASSASIWRAARPLRVYVYDMPEKFTRQLLSLFYTSYQETVNWTSNGSPVHRLIEQHSVDYWLYADLVLPQSQRQLESVVRVVEQSDADVFFVPFFTTISFFLLDKRVCKRLYREALDWILDQPAWHLSGGRDHVFPLHHPWSFKSVRHHVKNAIWLLPDLDATGNWYKPGQVSLEKDVVLPYASNVEPCDTACLISSLPERRTLLFFRGRIKRNAGGKIRNKLAALLQNEGDVVIEEGSPGEAGKQAAQSGMRSSIFCLSPAGDTPSSARLFDAILSGCIPVIVSDELELPFEGILDYKKIALFVSSKDALQVGWLLGYLRGIGDEQRASLRKHLAEYSVHFRYSNPAQPFGPEDLTWRMVATKLPWVKLHMRRAQRLVQGSRSLCTCACTFDNATNSYPEENERRIHSCSFESFQSTPLQSMYTHNRLDLDCFELCIISDSISGIVTTRGRRVYAYPDHDKRSNGHGWAEWQVSFDDSITFSASDSSQGASKTAADPGKLCCTKPFSVVERSSFPVRTPFAQIIKLDSPARTLGLPYALRWVWNYHRYPP